MIGAAAVTATAVLALLGGPAATAAPDPGANGNGAFTFAVIGDIPYGPDKIAAFPHDVDQINADRSVQFVDHLGDIKNGSSTCDDAYFSMIRAQFDRFRKPLVYTPGDNEWTDCHRPNNGSDNPLERLAKVRQVFFDQPGTTLGRRSAVQSQAAAGFPENVSYTKVDVPYLALHVVGSNDDLAPWTGIGNATPTPQQVAEEKARSTNVISMIDAAFDTARRTNQKTLVMMMQADMFDPTVPNPQFSDYSAFQPIVQEIAKRTAAFGKPVYLFNGDSHVYHADRPLAPGSPWLALYGAPPAPNLQRITVDGSAAADDYLRVTYRPAAAQPLSWERVPYTG